MTPIRNSQYSDLLPIDGHHDQADFHYFLPNYEASLPPCATPLEPWQGGSHGRDHQHSHHPQQEFCGSTPRSTPLLASPPTTMDSRSRNRKSTRESDPPNRDSSKWTPSEMRFVRRMTPSNGFAACNPRTMSPTLQDRQQQTTDGKSSSSNNNSNSHHGGVLSCTVRVCSDCNTTRTPLWRSGPRGPKSLCNACGIRRVRKARRAMAAAALSDVFIPVVAVPAAQPRKNKKSDKKHVPFKQRYCKFNYSTPGKLQLEELTISLSKNKAFHRVLPQDEKEAAVLLMALSCGLIGG